MADPGWAARTPEENDLLLKAGAGVITHLANQAAWTVLAATHHGSSIASTINTVATSASWTGSGSLASAANATALNASLHGLAGWVDVKPAVVSTAVSAYQMAYGSMRPAPECIENRTETATDYGINPLVLGALTPRITSLELEYFGSMWPNNSAVGASYGTILTALSQSLTIPPPIATMGASPAAPAQAAAAVGESAAEQGAGDGMRAAMQGAQTGTQGAGRAASGGQDFMSQATSLMQPAQQLMGAVPQVMQAPMQMMQAPMQMMQPLMGMFSNPGALGMGGATPAVSTVSATTGLSAAEAGAGGGASVGGAGVPATSFTRPVSAFEPATGGRPVGLRPAGALGAEAMRPQTTTMGGAPMGGMPVGHGAGGDRGSRDKADQPATVRVVDARV
ncbi:MULTISPECIES: PPE family protein [Mycobacterium]|uniref:PPE family protein n=1 Tax=Mycobacterium colombiense TaxID=339268 RepID=A0A329LZM2_9MYCO|nr:MULTISPECIES: PPE family protein [Mycobacterium]MDM4139752.1 PPE family protein [Mycobacterium sp. FLAC0960]RAV13455.1 PPE family protein [Mycobacterium colombiense]